MYIFSTGKNLNTKQSRYSSSSSALLIKKTPSSSILLKSRSPNTTRTIQLCPIWVASKAVIRHFDVDNLGISTLIAVVALEVFLKFGAISSAIIDLISFDEKLLSIQDKSLIINPGIVEVCIMDHRRSLNCLYVNILI
jgi:hypothetical protein